MFRLASRRRRRGASFALSCPAWPPSSSRDMDHRSHPSSTGDPSGHASSGGAPPQPCSRYGRLRGPASCDRRACIVGTDLRRVAGFACAASPMPSRICARGATLRPRPSGAPCRRQRAHQVSQGLRWRAVALRAQQRLHLFCIDQPMAYSVEGSGVGLLCQDSRPRTSTARTRRSR